MIDKPVTERTGTNAPSRTEPGRITLHTAWLYSDSDDCTDCPGKHAFARSGKITSSDWPPSYRYQGGLADHLHRAVASFGDDVDLVITVARADATAAAEERAHADGMAEGFRLAIAAAENAGPDQDRAVLDLFARRLHRIAEQHGLPRHEHAAGAPEPMRCIVCGAVESDGLVDHLRADCPRVLSSGAGA